jgi:delta14-sterol reductase
MPAYTICLHDTAFTSAVITIVGLGIGTLLQGADFVVWTFIWDNLIQIITANLIIAFALSWFVYIRSFSVKSGNPEHRLLAEGGHSGSMLYDWFIGRELNPRVNLPIFGDIDIKAFCELRPGMLGWVILNLSFIARQYRVYGYVSDSIIFLTAFQALYVFDGLYMEPAILTTIDIITDGFGFMLAFGDLVWLPFIYSLQVRYLAVYPVHLGFSGISAILAIQGLGYYIFRSTNNEKNRFRTNPNDPKVAHLEYMETKSGSKLLVSGWWGTARHINYLGDWIMSWSYSLPTAVAGYVIEYASPVPGTGHSPANGGIFGGEPVVAHVVQGEARGWGMIVTYFYVLYFAVLLVHRSLRDEEKCAKKYGKDWDEYKKKVPYAIIPYVY